MRKWPLKRLRLPPKESLIEQAEEVRKRAMEGNQFSAAISAIREMGVLSGMRIERKEVGPPGAFDDLSDEQLERALRERLARLGLLLDLPGSKRSTDQSFMAAAANDGRAHHRMSAFGGKADIGRT